MSVKTKGGFIATLLILGVVAVVGLQALDRSRDQVVRLMVAFLPAPRPQPVHIRFKINNVIQPPHQSKTSPWERNIAVTRGYTVVLVALQPDAGKLSCSLVVEGRLIGPAYADPVIGGNCMIATVA